MLVTLSGQRVQGGGGWVVGALAGKAETEIYPHPFFNLGNKLLKTFWKHF